MFDQDILYSLGAFMTICEVSRNNAEARVRDLIRNNWRRPGRAGLEPSHEIEPSVDDDAERDFATLARDQITTHVGRKFKGHALADLVAAILGAQGYTIHSSPPGPDKGVDILAAPGVLGFGSPRLCVQVKSGDSAVDRPTLDQLIGAMQNFGAEHGLLVSWAGFKQSVDREVASKFFKVRLWEAQDVVDALLGQYERLPEEIRAELPLQRIWTVVSPETEE